MLGALEILCIGLHGGIAQENAMRPAGFRSWGFIEADMAVATYAKDAQIETALFSDETIVTLVEARVEAILYGQVSVSIKVRFQEMLKRKGLISIKIIIEGKTFHSPPTNLSLFGPIGEDFVGAQRRAAGRQSQAAIGLPDNQIANFFGHSLAQRLIIRHYHHMTIGLRV
jgi:hypothetical protein